MTEKQYANQLVDRYASDYFSALTRRGERRLRELIHKNSIQWVAHAHHILTLLNEDFELYVQNMVHHHLAMNCKVEDRFGELSFYISGYRDANKSTDLNGGYSLNAIAFVEQCISSVEAGNKPPPIPEEFKERVEIELSVEHLEMLRQWIAWTSASTESYVKRHHNQNWYKKNRNEIWGKISANKVLQFIKAARLAQCLHIQLGIVGNQSTDVFVPHRDLLIQEDQVIRVIQGDSKAIRE